MSENKEPKNRYRITSGGTNLDIRLGEYWLAGVAVSGVAVAKSLNGGGLTRSLEGGLHTGRPSRVTSLPTWGHMGPHVHASLGRRLAQWQG